MDRPGVAFNCQVAPIMPFGIKGVLWYQGETNTEARDPRDYRDTLGLLIREWRKGFGDVPFLVVQLPGFYPPSSEPAAGNWAILREQQALIEKTTPDTHMVATIDMCAPDEPDHWHPKNKEIAGRRLAQLALRRVYGKEGVTDSGPRYASMTVEGDAVRVGFADLGGGLVAHPPVQDKLPASASPDSPLKAFALAGEDRQWKWADARIDGDTVVVTSPGVPRPVAVRYGWSNFPTCNLYSKAGWPAAPFRSDNWPLDE
jgi:sialate O-acetylesterase